MQEVLGIYNNSPFLDTDGLKEALQILKISRALEKRAPKITNWEVQKIPGLGKQDSTVYIMNNPCCNTILFAFPLFLKGMSQKCGSFERNLKQKFSI